MNELLASILNYIWVFIKLLLFSALISLPFVGLTYLLRKKFEFLRTQKKQNFAKSLFIIIFIVLYVILVLVYFIPVLDIFPTFTFLEAIAFILIQLARLLLVNLLFSGMLFIMGMFIALLYESMINKTNKNKKTKTKKKTEKFSFISLWKSFSMVFFVVLLFLLILFPSLIAMILFLIFM